MFFFFLETFFEARRESVSLTCSLVSNLLLIGLSSHRDGPLTSVRPCRDSLCDLLGVPKPVALAPTSSSSSEKSKTKSQQDELDSYKGAQSIAPPFLPFFHTRLSLAHASLSGSFEPSPVLFAGPRSCRQNGALMRRLIRIDRVFQTKPNAIFICFFLRCSKKPFLLLFMSRLVVIVAALLAVLVGCEAGSINDMEHIIIFMQENRAFDHYYGLLRGVRGFNDRAAQLLPSKMPVWYQQTNPLNASSYILPFHVDTLTTSATCMPGPS
jgi:hypothetical protein